MAKPKHGQSRTRTYNIWAMMLQRCTNPKAANYISYGGAGVTVCPRWYDFANFFADMGHPPTEKHTLDRIDNSLGYSPENCRWADPDTQQNNRTISTRITAFGETLSVTQWARKTGMTPDMIRHRVLVLGMDPEIALTTPKQSHVKRRIRRSQLDGSGAVEFDSLAQAAKSFGELGYEATKKGLWAALKRAGGSSAIYRGFSWEYVPRDQSSLSSTPQDPS